MRKILSLALAIMMVFSMTIMASAENTTVLTTTVPDAEYTLNIPADQTITFGKTETDIGNITVTNSSGFAEGKNLQVTLTYGPFSASGVNSKIPYTIQKRVSGFTASPTVKSGDSIVFEGDSNGTVYSKTMMTVSGPSGTNSSAVTNFYVCINSEDWGKALGGTYTSSIIFTAEVVIEE